MIKTAIFVEGLTERKFIKKMINRRYNERLVLVKEMVLKGKGSYFNSADDKKYPGYEFLLYLVEVPDYTKVTSMIVQSAKAMVDNYGFAFVIGLRDLLPNERGEEKNVINLIRRLIETTGVKDQVEILLSIMEIEAWFLCDFNMLKRVDPTLTPDKIKKELKLDITTIDPEIEFDNPYKILDKIFQLALRRYRKHEQEIDMVVDNLDYDYLCSVKEKIKSFARFNNKLDSCLRTL